MKHNIYQRLALIMSQENDLAHDKAPELAYAMEILFINGLNLLLTMLIGYLLGVLQGTIACVLVAIAYRHIAGGAHAKSPWVCAVATMIVFPALAYAGTYIAAGPHIYSWITEAAAVIVGFYAVHKYAPVDTPKAPIVSPDRRKRLKRYSYLVIGILVTMMIALELISTLWLYSTAIQVCAALAILWVSLNLTHTAASLWCMLDNQH